MRYLINLYPDEKPAIFARDLHYGKQGSAMNPAMGWDEVYNPDFATRFETKEAADVWVMYRTTLSPDHYIVVPADDIAHGAYLWWKAGGLRRTMQYVNNSFSRPYDPEKDTVRDVINFYVHADGKNARSADYKTWPFLFQLCKHLFGVTKYTNGEVSFDVCTSKDGKFSEFESEVREYLDIVTRKDDEGRLVLSVLDYMLSEGGDSVTIRYDQVKDHWFIEPRYEDGISFGTDMEAMFEYLKKNRYYEG